MAEANYGKAKIALYVEMSNFGIFKTVDFYIKELNVRSVEMTVGFEVF